jgi:hypothetical protein
VLGVATAPASIVSIVRVIVFRIWSGIQRAKVPAVRQDARHVDRAA